MPLDDDSLLRLFLFRAALPALGVAGAESTFARKRVMAKRRALVSVIITCGLCATLSPEPSVGENGSPSRIGRETFDQWMKELSNWGRWGKDDQLGTINLITPAKKKQAAALVKDGISVSLSRIPSTRAAFDNDHSFESETVISSTIANEEIFKFSYHGLSHVTHVDSLAHFFHEGKMYNGFVQQGVPAFTLGVENLRDGVVTRGILIDIPRLRGLPYLEPGTVIQCDELDAWLTKVNLKVMPGDAILLRTGRWAYREQHNPHPLRWAGLHISCAKWLKERDVAIAGSDFATEAINDETTRSEPLGSPVPLHKLALVAMGMPLIDQLDLERLADEATRRQRWEFMFVSTPLAIRGASGSPVNPVAIF